MCGCAGRAAFVSIGRARCAARVVGAYRCTRRRDTSIVSGVARCIHQASAVEALPTRFKRVSVTCPPDVRLDRFVRECVLLGDDRSAPTIALFNQWMRKRLLRILKRDGEIVSTKLAGNYKLNAGDALIAHESIRLVPASSTELRQPAQLVAAATRCKEGEHHPSWLTGGIKYVDANLVVFSKPAGIATQGGTGIQPRLTLDYWLPAIERHLAASTSIQQKQSGSSAAPVIVKPIAPVGTSPLAHDSALKLVHRLDRDVSGLLLLARNRATAEACRQCLASRSGITKTYVALVGGPWSKSAPLRGEVDVPVTHVESQGGDKSRMSHHAITQYEAVPLPAVAAPLTLLLLHPVTGRKHQLRQHARHMFGGMHGIMGDTRYRGQAPPVTSTAAAEGAPTSRRLLLHSVHLRLLPELLNRLPSAGATPTTSRPVDVIDELPAEFATCLRSSDINVRERALAFSDAAAHWH